MCQNENSFSQNGSYIIKLELVLFIAEFQWNLKQSDVTVEAGSFLLHCFRFCQIDQENEMYAGVDF